MSDRQQRRLAVAPGRSVIVQAPAGSGKTTLLVERFLALLGVVEQPEQILAITFTRKAAAEMRERVLRFLRPGFDTDEAHEQAALARARAISDRVREWNLVANPDRLMIRTIDSFSHYLARSMPVASRLGPVPRPAEDTGALYRRAARRVLQALEDDPISADLEAVLMWRDNRTRDIEDLLVSLLGKREQWLRALGVTGKPDRARFEEVLQAVVSETLGRANAALEAALASAGIEGLADLLGFSAETLLAEGRSSDVCVFAEDRRLPTPDPGDLPLWRGLGEALLTKTGTWRKSVTITTGFAPKAPQKALFQECLQALAGNDALAELLHRARGLPQPRYNDDEWQVLSALIRVLERAAGELELVFVESGQTDFTGLSRAALQGLGDTESGFTDLGLYLDNRISHILLDEYQDTNWAQYHLLEKLTHGWHRGDGRTLFLVGDPMQSIYRFREAEVGLFMRTRDRGLSGLRLDSLRLDQNFRSKAEIVDWVNQTLGPAFPDREDIAAGAVAYARSVAGQGPGGGVELLARADRRAEAEAIAERIEQALAENAGDPDYKAAIIVRARSHLSEILPALQARGIGFRAVKLDPLLSRPVVQDLLALTRAIHFPADLGAVLAVLRSPVCGLTLADLHGLAGDGANPFEPDALDRLEGDARERAARVYQALATARARIGQDRLRDRVEGAWRILGGQILGGQSGEGKSFEGKSLGGAHALRQTHTERAEAGLFFDTLEAAEHNGLIEDWLEFEQLLAGQFTKGDPTDPAVKLEILTMHGAKGLEWDLVVLPGLDRATGRVDAELLYWLPLTPEHGDEQVLLSPLRAAWQSDNTPLIDLIRAEQRARDRYENERLLYVAATRARKQLLASSVIDPTADPPRPAADSLLEILWPRVAPDLLDSLNHSSASGSESDSGSDQASTELANIPDQTLRRVPSGWRPPIGPRLEWQPATPPREREPEIEFNWAGMQARRTGTVLHALLEQVGRRGMEQLSPEHRQRLLASIPDQLRMLGTRPGALDETAALIAEAFQHTLASDSGRWILSGNHRDAACELPLSGVIDGEAVHAIIDRTFIDEAGTRWIIDYKSGYHEGGDLEGFLAEEAGRYETQLGLYRQLFEHMGETEIRTALYLPRHGILREA